MRTPNPQRVFRTSGIFLVWFQISELLPTFQFLSAIQTGLVSADFCFRAECINAALKFLITTNWPIFSSPIFHLPAEMCQLCSKLILFHSRKNNLTLDSLFIYYSFVISFHLSSFTERRQPPIKKHHFISLCAANHLSHSLRKRLSTYALITT